MADAYMEENVNEFGSPVSVFTCESCGDVFTVCPVVPEDTRDQWTGCQAELCDSYDPSRDADLYFALGMVGGAPVGDGGPADG